MHTTPAWQAAPVSQTLQTSPFLSLFLFYVCTGKHYQHAIDLYTKAADLNPASAIYLANRAFAHIKMECYGAAVADAGRAIGLDPRYVKGYYRRGDANFMLGRFKEALKDLRTVGRWLGRAKRRPLLAYWPRCLPLQQIH